MLISRVKNFNLRFKALAYSGDPSVAPPAGLTNTNMEDFHPKETPAFRELDELVSTFKAGFPPHMKDPMVDGKLDGYLYTALNMSNL